MQGILSVFITTCCGSILTLFIFTITILIQNSERIGKLISKLWNSFWKLNISIYKAIIDGFANLVGINPLEGSILILITSTISVILAVGFLLIFDLRIAILVLVIALVHGILIGITWNKFDDPSGLDLGRKLE